MIIKCLKSKHSFKDVFSLGFQRHLNKHCALGIMYCRKWLLLTVCLVASAAGYAGVNVSDTLSAAKVFANIPLEVLDMIRPSVRLDMLDYYSQADSILTVQNALGDESRLQRVAPDYLKVYVTPVSTLEIKLLKAGNRTIIMTLYTIDNSVREESETESGNIPIVADTEIKFFDSSLAPLSPDKFLKAPALKDFFDLKGSGISETELLEKIPFTAIVYSTGEGETPLYASFTSLSTLPKEDRDFLAPLLRPKLSAPWKSKYNFK